jgi:uncharacterized cupredoxin-like copper-binding protein
MRRISKLLSIAALAAVCVLVWPAAGAVAKSSKGKPVTVQLYEFGVKPKPKFVAAGKVTFTAKNIGTMKHEMVVVRSTGQPLPTKPDGSVDEEAIPEADKMGKVGSLKPKKSGTLTVKNLAAGDYEIFCNLTTKDSQGTTYVHYAQGMHQTFTAG